MLTDFVDPEEAEKLADLYGSNDPSAGAVHKIGAGAVFGMSGRPGLRGAAVAHTEVKLIGFDRGMTHLNVSPAYVDWICMS